MNEINKENSPLELYETAYKYHYIEGNIPEACRVYKAIIDEFPNSNECGYSVIQLQKIQANEVSGGLRFANGRFSPLQLIVAGLCVIVCLALSTAAFLSLKKTKADTEALSLVSQAICMIYAGYESDALEILAKAKVVSDGKLSAPYLLSANIYINMQQYARAKAEYDIFQRTSGKNDAAFRKMVSIKIEKVDKKTLPVKVDSPAVTEAAVVAEAPQTPPPPPPQVLTKPASQERAIAQPGMARIKQKAERARAAHPAKSGGKSSQNAADTISFF
jgi:tetratricopeptide (TPR) repeat protein